MATTTTDPLQMSRNLGPRIAALRAEAAAIRTKNHEVMRERDAALGIERDRLARDRAALEQTAANADRQVKAYNDEVTKKNDDISQAQAMVARNESAGDHRLADEVRELIVEAEAQKAAMQARADRAFADAAEARGRAATISPRLEEINTERADMYFRRDRIERETDKLEEQANIYEDLRGKWSQIALDGDDIPKRAALELEIEALTAKADKIVVNRDEIRSVVPDLPATTPGIDDPPPPLPPVSDDATADVLGTDDVMSSVAAAPAAPAAEAAETGEADAAAADAPAPSTADPMPPEDTAMSSTPSDEAASETPAAFDDQSVFDDPASVEATASFDDTTSSYEGSASFDDVA